MDQPKCRFCAAPLSHVQCDLGMSPLANSYVKFEHAHNTEKLYPLKVWVCDQCLLSQLEAFESPDAIFSDYPYFSSFSTTWVEHARHYCEMMVQRFGFNARSQIVEIASNDGYLLQHFKAKGIPVLGVEPAANVAKVAWEQKQIPSVMKFFGVQTAKELVADGKTADLLLGNNVLAHVPDINDFLAGLKIALKTDGIITFEFPHLLRLIKENQFDTIYHEHFSYLSLLATEKIFAQHGLTLFDVEEVPTHGGSLRIFARHTENTTPPATVTDRVATMRAQETDFGLRTMPLGRRSRQRSESCCGFSSMPKKTVRVSCATVQPLKASRSSTTAECVTTWWITWWTEVPTSRIISCPVSGSRSMDRRKSLKPNRITC
jgi:2-polyprenyl-3-methyl-5-hydroxy-6-metoxy-1,4-benzoquinol methylase